jgi:hypothetical protein
VESTSRDSARRDEDEGERLDRELLELLNELRVAMPGVQVLFGFLLTVPFQQGFQRINDTQRTVYFVTLLLAAAASAFLIAPSSYHRIMFREGDKPRLIKLGTRLTLAGLLCLMLAMCCAVTLVTDIIFTNPTVTATAAVVGALYLWLWFGLALSRKLRGKASW